MTGLNKETPSRSGDPDETGTDSEQGLRRDTASLLHRLVLGMNLDNFVVRPQRKWVELYVDPLAWHLLTPEGAGIVGEHLSGLPTSVRDDDEQAKRFDLLMLRLQLTQLTGEPGFDRLRMMVQQVAAALLDQRNIPLIAAQVELLDDIAGDDWWFDVTLPMLELVRRRVRGLVKLIEKARQVVVYTDVVDVLGEVTEIALQGVTIAADFERFRVKARVYLRAHDDHLALQKVRRNVQLSRVDVEELGRMLTEGGVGGPSETAAPEDVVA